MPQNDGPAATILQLIGGGFIFEHIIQPLQAILASLGMQPEGSQGPTTVQDRLGLVLDELGGPDSLTIQEKTHAALDRLDALDMKVTTILGSLPNLGQAIDGLSQQLGQVASQLDAVQASLNSQSGKADHALELLGNELAPDPPHLSAIRTQLNTIQATLDALANA